MFARDTSRRWPAALTLALIAPCLTELFSGNIPAPIFFRPHIFFVLTLIYGIPALLFRDLLVRWRLGLPGLFALGLAYGIYNEGVIAKTILRPQGVPIPQFDHSLFLGINWSWSAMIVPWHALHAVIFPIAIVSWLLPAARNKLWLSPASFAFATIVAVLLGSLLFFKNPAIVASGGMLVALWGAIALLVGLSKMIPQKSWFAQPEGEPGWPPVVAGFFLYPVMIIGLSVCASRHPPALVVWMLSLLVVCVYYRLAVCRRWLAINPFVLLALGDYLSGSLLNIPISIAHGSMPRSITAVAFTLIFAGEITAVFKPAAGRPAG